MKAEQAKEPRKWVLCEICNTGFAVLASEWDPAGFQFCPTCQIRRNKIALLRLQLAEARQFGHTPTECDLCAIQNQLDDLIHNGYDWREEYEKRLNNLSSFGDSELIR